MSDGRLRARMHGVGERHGAHVPLSHAQERLWFIDRLNRGRVHAHMMTTALRFGGAVDVQALRHAVDAIAARHEILRTRFVEIDGHPYQIVDQNRAVDMNEERIVSVAGTPPDPAIARRVREVLEAPFDLARDHLLRVALFQVAAEEWIFVRTTHHIVFDNWSDAVFNRELLLLYDAFRHGDRDPLPPVPLQYGDYALWQRELAVVHRAESLAYWLSVLERMPERLNWRTDATGPHLPRREAASHLATIPSDVCDAVRALARAHGASMHMALLTVFVMLIARYSDEEDVAVMVPASDRYDARLTHLVGLFVNSLILRAHVDPAAPGVSVLCAIRDRMLEAYEHRHVPFQQLVEALAPMRAATGSPLIQIAFDYQWQHDSLGQPASLDVSVAGHGEARVGLELEVHARWEQGRLRVGWLYDATVFARWRIEQLAHHFERLLTLFVAMPQQACGDLPLLSDDERRMVIEQWNAPVQESVSWA